MSENINPEELQRAISECLKGYVEDIEDDVKKETNDMSKEVVQELKNVSPRGHGSRSNPYWQGWTKQVQNKNKGKYIIKVHNKTNYQLTHLLEFGHATRNGRRTKAIPHIRPTEEKYKDLYEKSLTTIIKRRSKK